MGASLKDFADIAKMTLAVEEKVRPDWVLNRLVFERGIRPAEIITLERNYRSTQPILAAANGVIDLASERFTKNLWTERQSADRPRLVSVRDEADQARYIVEKVLEN